MIIALLPLVCFAQSTKKKLDSLNLVLKTAKDTTRINTLQSLSTLHWAIDLKKSAEYANTALAESKEIGYEKGIATSLYSLAEIKLREGEYSTSLKLYNDALKMFQELGLQKDIANCFNNIAAVYYHKGEYDTVLQYLLKSARIREGLNDKEGMASLYNNMAIIYLKQGNLSGYQKDFDKAMEYNLKSLKIRQEFKDTTRVAASYSNIALVYQAMNNDSLALEYHERALKIREAENDKAGMAICYSNIGTVYYDLGKEKKNKEHHAKAIEYLTRAKDIYTGLDQKAGLSGTLNNLGAVYEELGRYSEALEAQEKALELASDLGKKEVMKNAYIHLSSTHRKLGNYEKALDYHEKWTAIKDSMLNDEKNKQMAELDKRYESEKQEREIELLNKEKAISDTKLEKQDAVRNFLIGVIALALVLVAVSFVAYRNKKRSNELLNMQKQQIEHQKQEITDSITYARNIQQALLPPREEITAVIPGFFVLYRPKDIVSGDFYWFSVADASRNAHLVAAADCTGHGVPGAFMSMIGVEKLNELAKTESRPGEILTELNRAVKKALRQSGEGKTRDGMDIALVAIDRAGSKLSFAGANRPLYIVKRNREQSTSEDLIEIKPTKAAIGGHTSDEQQFETQELQLERGDMIYLFSDGFADQFGGPSGKKLMTGKFRELLASIAHNPIKEQELSLERYLDEWKGLYEQVDDILVIGLQV
jgi:serine phosphatase RsbU (regulator of sigma subunit)